MGEDSRETLTEHQNISSQGISHAISPVESVQQVEEPPRTQQLFYPLGNPNPIRQPVDNAN